MYYGTGQKLKFSIQYSCRPILNQQMKHVNKHLSTAVFQVQLIMDNAGWSPRFSIFSEVMDSLLTPDLRMNSISTSCFLAIRSSFDRFASLNGSANLG